MSTKKQMADCLQDCVALIHGDIIGPAQKRAIVAEAERLIAKVRQGSVSP